MGVDFVYQCCDCAGAVIGFCIDPSRVWVPVWDCDSKQGCGMRPLQLFWTWSGWTHIRQAAHEFGLRDVGCKPYATEQPNDKAPARYFSHPTLLIELCGAVILSGAGGLLLKLGDYNWQPTDLIAHLHANKRGELLNLNRRSTNPQTFPKGPRTEIIGFQGLNTINIVVFGP